MAQPASQFFWAAWPRKVLGNPFSPHPPPPPNTGHFPVPSQGNYSLHSFSVLRLVKPQHSNGNAASHYMINECLTALGEKTTQKTSNGWIIEPVPGARREALGKAPPVPGSRHASCSAGPAWLLGTAGMGSLCVSEPLQPFWVKADFYRSHLPEFLYPLHHWILL